MQYLRERFNREGYLVLDNFFDESLMDRYHQAILNHFGTDPAFYHDETFLQTASTEVIPWFPQREGVGLFDEVARDERFMQLTESVVGEGWQDQYSMVMFSKQGTRGQAWHQDCPPDVPGRFNVNRLIYTHDLKPEEGGLVIVVPGSHKRGLLSIGDPAEDFEDQVVLTPRKGTLVLLHGHTWHRVLPVTGAYRVSTNYRCAPQGTPEDITDVCVYRNMRYRFSTNEIVEERVA